MVLAALLAQSILMFVIGYAAAFIRVNDLIGRELRHRPRIEVLEFMDALWDVLLPARINRWVNRQVAEHSDDTTGADDA